MTGGENIEKQQKYRNKDSFPKVLMNKNTDK